MSQEATSRRADSGAASAASGIYHPSPAPASSSSRDDAGTGTLDYGLYGSFSEFFQEYMWDFVIGDPLEHRIEAQIEDQVLRQAGASRATRRQAAALREETRARMQAMRWQSARVRADAARSRADAARSREGMRGLTELSDMLGVDVSGYTEAQRAEYERELDRRSRELLLFGSRS